MGHPTCNNVRILLEAVYHCASCYKDSKILPFDDPKNSLQGYIIYAPSLDPPAEYSVERSVVMASNKTWRDIMSLPDKRLKTCHLPYLKELLYGRDEFETEEITNPIASLEVE